MGFNSGLKGLIVVVIVVAAVLVTVAVTVALHFQQIQVIFLFSKMSRPALCPAQPLTQFGTEGFSPGAKAAWACS
jgi:hypothetical protein